MQQVSLAVIGPDNQIFKLANFLTLANSGPTTCELTPH